jgi:hypothetical protein
MAVQPLGTDTKTAMPAATVAREVIVYGGRRFSCTPEMARIFLKHAREVIEGGVEQLVPLLHSGGIELLLVSRATPYSLLDRAED